MGRPMLQSETQKYCEKDTLQPLFPRRDAAWDDDGESLRSGFDEMWQFFFLHPLVSLSAQAQAHGGPQAAFVGVRDGGTTAVARLGTRRGAQASRSGLRDARVKPVLLSHDPALRTGCCHFV